MNRTNIMNIKWSVILVIFVLLPLGSQAFGQEAKYYALFLTKFTDYIKWPSVGTGQKVVIGVLGNSQVATELSQIAAAKKGQIEIMQISQAEEADKCHMLFLPKEQAAKFESLNQSIGNSSILLVTENEDLAEKGAGISFYLEGSKLKFKLNKAAIESKNIKISNSLLALATVL